MRILFVAMPNSVHVARWIDLLSERDWDIRLFPVYDAVPHPGFKNVTLYGFSSYRPRGMDRSVRLRGVWPLRKGSYRLSGLLRRLFPFLPARSAWLAWFISQLKPDIVHSLEIQHAGYLTLEAKAKLKDWSPAWIVSNWGSDLFFFGRQPGHAVKIREVLSGCDYYACECQRDVALARAFGFRGKTFPVLPNTGGDDIKEVRKHCQPGPTSQRRVVALKGRQGWSGRALIGLKAIRLSSEYLRDYRVVIYLASEEVEAAAEKVADETGIKISILPPSPRERVLQLHGSARVSIGLSLSDGISTSLLEAMMMGAFPIQSNTACADEWVADGTTGLIVPPEDPGAVAAALRRALTDDNLVDRGAERNVRVAVRRLERSAIRPQVIAAYEEVAARAAAKKGGA